MKRWLSNALYHTKYSILLCKLQPVLSSILQVNMTTATKRYPTMIYWRDNFQCRHCKNRNGLHPHHVTFRSQGGNDDMNNVITLCACCHLDGVHKGNLKIEVVERTEDDVIVKFTRKGKWKPT